MDFGDILNDKRKCKEIALAHWNGSKLTDDGQLRAPKVGDTWPAPFLPYWRKWMRERPVTPQTHFSAWASVNDLPFWKALVKNINDDVVIGRGLAWAGMHGNMAAFKAASPAALDYYATNTFAAPISGHRIMRLASGQAKIVHPDVVIFMRDRGSWDQAQIGQLARAYAVGDPDGAGILRIGRGSQGLYGFEPSFYSDWYTKALTHLNWNADEQTQFIAHIVGHVDRHFDIVKHAKNTKLRPDVDLPLVQLCQGSGLAWVFGAEFDTFSPGLKQVYTTVVGMAVAMRSGQPWVAGSDSHAGLAMLMDLTSATTPMDLYRLGLQCSNIEKGLVPPLETFALPTI